LYGRLRWGLEKNRFGTQQRGRRSEWLMARHHGWVLAEAGHVDTIFIISLVQLFPTVTRPDRPIPYTFGSCKLATLPVSKLGRLSYRVISKACFAIYSSSDTTSRPRCRTCHRILPRAHSHSHSFSLAVLMYRCSVKRNETS
jgi:hypothetical protein